MLTHAQNSSQPIRGRVFHTNQLGDNDEMELNSLLILLEAAEYLERRDREAEHGYASVLPYRDDFSSKKTKASPISRKTQNNRSSHNELEKHRRAKLRLYLDQLKKLVPLGPDSTRHTTLSLLKRAKMHIKKLEELDKKALNTKEQLQREHRYLKRRLEQLSVSGSSERIRTDSMGSTISTDSEQDVDIEGMSSRPARRTVWTASATARKRRKRRRRRTTTASRAAPATPATQPHIPTDCSRTTVRTPSGHPPPNQLPPPRFPPPLTYTFPDHLPPTNLHQTGPQRRLIESRAEFVGFIGDFCGVVDSFDLLIRIPLCAHNAIYPEFPFLQLCCFFNSIQPSTSSSSSPPPPPPHPRSLLRHSPPPPPKTLTPARLPALPLSQNMFSKPHTEIYFSGVWVFFLRAQKHSVIFGEVSRQREREKERVG
ncbi:hypothetical protein F7725_005728 [Dissostichus mawsoni]|uniref:BHLH domain-containing protein n=1 Tax=Dissostichus mawsoni TaxID=36200 RepID=A0A7J5YTB9_DISMA|nr:hypothetical protein F7725_005728 [Dissostichus mawsoni]